jgi:transcriptional regulator with XRE-family HTH domain
MTKLGDALRRFRQQRRNMSQAELATASGLSVSTIKRLESDDDEREIKRSTLMMTAQGLAKDFDGNADKDTVEAIYTDLIRAAGILPPERPAAAPAGAISRDAFVREMEQRIGEPLAIAMSTVGWHYDEIPEEIRAVLEPAIIALAGARKKAKDE